MVSHAPRMVRLPMVIEAGELMGVEGLMATAFQPPFVISTDSELFGRIPRDQADESSQLPLVGLVKVLVLAIAGAIATKKRNGIKNELRQRRVPELNAPQRRILMRRNTT